jgi:PAS domain S-box-containing protein
LDPLHHIIISATSACMVAVLTYAYLYFSLRDKWMGLWALSWAFYLLRRLVSLAPEFHSLQQGFLITGYELGGVWSAYLLLLGTFSFLGKPCSKYWFAATIASSIGLLLRSLMGLPFPVLALPTAAVAAAACIVAGVSLLRSPKHPGLTAAVTGWALLFWGLHKGTGPFLTGIEWQAPGTSVLLFVPGLLVAVGFVVLNFEDRNRQISKGREVLERINTTIPIGLILFSPEMTITMVNSEAAKLLELAGDFVGKHVRDIPASVTVGQSTVQLSDSPFTLEKNTVISFSGASYQVELPTGRSRIFQVNVSTPKNDNGEVLGYLVAFSDVTEQHLQREQLTRLNRSLMTLSEANEAVLRATDAEELITRVLNTLMSGSVYSDAWYGRYTNGELTPRFAVEDSPTQTISDRQRSIALRALREGRPQVKQPSPGGAIGSGAGLVAIPVVVPHHESGVLVLTAPDPSGFDDEELALLERVAGNVAFGIQALSRRRELDRLMAALTHSEKRFRALFEASTVGIGLVRGSLLVDSNPAIRRLFGFPKGTPHQSIDFLHYIAPEERTRISEMHLKSLDGEAPDNASYETWGQKVDGSRFPIQVTTTLLPLPEGTSTLLYVQDITERTAARDAALAYEEQLRAMASQLALAEERERRDLASLLHDGIIQNLAAVKNRLSQSRTLSQSAAETDIEIEQSLALLSETINDTRSLTLQISPPILYHLGIEAAVDWLSDWLLQRHGLAVTVVDRANGIALPDELASVLFRAIRELLINVHKHSGVSAATVTFTREDGWLQVTVADSGKGCELDDARTLKGYGLFSIKERFIHLGGHFTLESAPGEGTRVTLELAIPTPS